MKRQIKQSLSVLYNYLSTPFQKSKSALDLSVFYQPAPPGLCGIACVFMIVNPPSKKVTFSKFASKYHSEKYYHLKKGWRHQGLVDILNSNKLQAKINKYQPTGSLIAHLTKTRQPIIASILVPPFNNLASKGWYKKKQAKPPNETHLVVVKGVKNNHLIIHDSRNIFHYSKNTLVPINEFNKVFTGNFIQITSMK